MDLIPSYKAHRVAEETPEGADEEEMPDTLSPQVPVIEAVLDALGIARVGVAGYEADDVIGTLTGRATGPVDIVTGDRDLYQLVDDERGVRVLYPLKGVGTLQLTDEAWLREKYGVDRAGYVDLALLRGDPSDGLPGVPGHRREDRREAAGRLRRPGRDHGRGRRPARQAHPVPAQAARRGAALCGGGARRWCGSRGDVPLPAVRPGAARAPARPGHAGRAGGAVGAGRRAATRLARHTLAR